MIATITINPALDKSTRVEKLVPEKKLRCDDLIIEAGGGGINVSKGLKKLGDESMAIFTSGGTNGHTLENILTSDGILFRAIPAKGETRENFTVTDMSSMAQYRFVMPGSELLEDEIERCFSVIGNLRPQPSIIVASGSLPPGAPPDIYSRIAIMAREKMIRLIVDTSGSPLQLAARAGVYLLKPNLSELSGLVGKSYLELNEIEDAARQVVEQGNCEVLVVSQGPAGALLVTADTRYHVPAPTVKKLSTVGAGDSMIAGIVWMLEQQASLLDMLSFGVACGTAATMNEGTRLFERDDALRLFDWIKRNRA